MAAFKRFTAFVSPVVLQWQSAHWAAGGRLSHRQETRWEPRLSPPAPSESNASHPNLRPHRVAQRSQLCGHAEVPWLLYPACTEQSPEGENKDRWWLQLVWSQAWTNVSKTVCRNICNNNDMHLYLPQIFSLPVAKALIVNVRMSFS